MSISSGHGLFSGGKSVRRLLGLAALAVAAMAFSGCGTDEAGGGSAATKPGATDHIKIGFVVKQPDEPWFQNEWKFAQSCAEQNHFELIKIAAKDGNAVLSAIDSLNANGAKGFVICTPDPKLGPAIMKQADAAGLKVLAVDDRFVGSDGKFMEDVHYLGISPYDIGHQAGELEIAEMKKRGWKVEDTAVCKSSYEELDTARQRTDGASAALIDGGIPKEKIYNAPNKETDLPHSYDAANICLTQHPEVKHWLIIGINDSGVLGPVKAMGERGFAAEDIIGIGINGTDCIGEFKKDKPTGFVGSMLLSPRKHGFDTTMMMYKWVKDGVEPPKATFVKSALFITRDTYAEILKKEGLAD
jgi:L-arabinose transport system substrate-binding protein